MMYPKWILYGCPRCHGAMQLSEPVEHDYTCLQCGYILYGTPPMPLIVERMEGKFTEVKKHRRKRLTELTCPDCGKTRLVQWTKADKVKRCYQCANDKVWKVRGKNALHETI